MKKLVSAKTKQKKTTRRSFLLKIQVFSQPMVDKTKKKLS